jgi:hypothetical protein
MTYPKKVKTPLQAIRAKCPDCSGGDAAEVEGCAILHCPLYAFRTGLELRCDAVQAQEQIGRVVPAAGEPGTGPRETRYTTQLKQAKKSNFSVLPSLL